MGHRMSNFCRVRLPTPRNGLFVARHESLVHSHSSYRSVQKRMSTYDKGRQLPTDGEYQQLVSVCNTSRREASSSLLRRAIESTKGGSQI